MTDFKAFTRRAFLPAALAAGSVLSLFGGTVPKAFAAPPAADTRTQITAPTVSENDVIDLFDDVLIDKFNAWKNRNNFNTEDNLYQKLSNAQTEQRRALILAFDAMGGIARVRDLANKKFDTWGRSEDADRDYDTIPLRYSAQQTGNLVAEAVKADANSGVPYGEQTMSFAKEVKEVANSLLRGASKHQMGFGEYVVKVCMPFDPNDNQTDIAIRDAAKRLKVNANSTMALNSAFVPK